MATLCYLAAMGGAARTLITPEEYLSMEFDGREPEYVRGELIYKPMPDFVHGYIQALLAALLVTALRPGGYRVLTELRTQLAPDNFRLPDVAVFGPGQSVELVPTRAPLVAVEIISKDERHSAILEKLEDYEAWGVANIWTVDPIRRRLSVFSGDTLKHVDAVELPGTAFSITIDELLKDLPQGLL